MHYLLERVRNSIQHRPWTVDIISGVVLCAYGIFALHDHRGLEIKAYRFLADFDIATVAAVMFLMGALQLAVALMDLRAWRRCVAFVIMWNWIAFVLGIHLSDPSSAAAVAYGGYALANALIVARV